MATALSPPPGRPPALSPQPPHPLTPSPPSPLSSPLTPPSCIRANKHQAETLRAKQTDRLASHRSAAAGAQAAAAAATGEAGARADAAVAQWASGKGVIEMLQTLHELGGGAFLREPIAPNPGQLKRAFFRAVRAVHPDKVRSSARSPCTAARPRAPPAAPDLLAPLTCTPPRSHPHPACAATGVVGSSSAAARQKRLHHARGGARSVQSAQQVNAVL